MYFSEQVDVKNSIVMLVKGKDIVVYELKGTRGVVFNQAISG